MYLVHYFQTFFIGEVLVVYIRILMTPREFFGEGRGRVLNPLNPNTDQYLIILVSPDNKTWSRSW